MWNRMMKELGLKIYISVTREPEQVIPFHDCPQGSSPFAFHWVNWEGEFKLVYKTLKAEAVDQNWQ